MQPTTVTIALSLLAFLAAAVAALGKRRKELPIFDVAVTNDDGRPKASGRTKTFWKYWISDSFLFGKRVAITKLFYWSYIGLLGTSWQGCQIECSELAEPSQQLLSVTALHRSQHQHCRWSGCSAGATLNFTFFVCFPPTENNQLCQSNSQMLHLKR